MTIETQSGGEPVVISGPYNGNGVTASFDYDFQIQDADELLVTVQNTTTLVETVLVLTTDYTVSGVGSDTGGSITLVDAASDLPTGTKMVIQYKGDYNQSLDYSNQGRIQLQLLEDSLDKLTMHTRQLKELVDRSVKVDAFGTVDIDTLQTNLNVLAAITSDITAVAAISADVTAVADDATDIGAVAAAIADISAVAADLADITAVAADAADIGAVAAIAADIATVNSNIAAINAVNANAANINAVNANEANINTVAADSADIAVVAANSDDISALVADGGGALAGDYNPSGEWDFSGNTDAITPPGGTEAQRPGTPALGMWRVNEDDGVPEWYDGTFWVPQGRLITFTPTFWDDDTAGNQGSTVDADGYCYIIGRLCYFGIFCFNLSTSGMTGANALYIRGFPAGVRAEEGNFGGSQGGRAIGDNESNFPPSLTFRWPSRTVDYGLFTRNDVAAPSAMPISTLSASGNSFSATGTFLMDLT